LRDSAASHIEPKDLDALDAQHLRTAVNHIIRDEAMYEPAREFP
jgi:hypothetical protein